MLIYKLCGKNILSYFKSFVHNIFYLCSFFRSPEKTEPKKGRLGTPQDPAPPQKSDILIFSYQAPQGICFLAIPAPRFFKGGFEILIIQSECHRLMSASHRQHKLRLFRFCQKHKSCTCSVVLPLSQKVSAKPALFGSPNKRLFFALRPFDGSIAFPHI